MTSGMVSIVVYTDDNIGAGHDNGHRDEIFTLIDFIFHYMLYINICHAKWY